MRVLGSIIEPSPRFLAGIIADHFHCSPIGAKFIRHNDFRIAVFLHGFLQELQGSLVILSLGEKSFKNFSFVIDGSP